MSRRLNKNSREGFIIVISLMLMLVMTTMGVGLYYSSKQTSKEVANNINRSDALYTAEACIADARLWLKANSTPDAPCLNVEPGKICQNVTSQNMSRWSLTNDSQILQNRNTAQIYTCTISLLGSAATSGGEGTGFDIGESDDYGNSSVNTKYFYRIRSTGTMNESSGMRTFRSAVEVIDSMIF
tara:strand:+ start:16 stop:567 length:552 start_codon:yes stop_codon:yes gene_type:complete